MLEMERKRLIENLISEGYLRSPEVIKAFKNVPRHEFVPKNLREYSYADQPLSIGYGQTISAPSMIAIMMESLEFKRGQNILEIGTGSGYNAALTAEIVGRTGKIVTIERVTELAEFARSNLKKTGYNWIKVIVGDGTQGYEEEAPWDRILVTACAPAPPKPLIEQLKDGGKLGAPVGDQYMHQTWTVIEKTSEGKLKTQKHCGCSFVPLIGEYGWK